MRLLVVFSYLTLSCLLGQILVISKIGYGAEDGGAGAGLSAAT
jgi:hypothetical protein